MPGSFYKILAPDTSHDKHEPNLKPHTKTIDEFQRMARRNKTRFLS